MTWLRHQGSGNISGGGKPDGNILNFGFIQARLKNLGYAYGDGSFDQYAVDQPRATGGGVLDLNNSPVEIAPLGKYPTLLADDMFGDAVVLDCNLDGVTSSDDLVCVSTIEERDAVLATLNVLPGDLDLNGEIGFSDYVVLSSSFGSASSLYIEGNIDLMNGTDFTDFLILSSNFGESVGTVETIPEPANLGRLCLCFLCIAALARRRK